MLQSVVLRPNSPAFSYVNLRAYGGFASDGKEACNEFPCNEFPFLPTHINLVTTSLLMISLSSLPAVQTPTLNSSYERAYLYRNLDPLSTKTSHPYPFLSFSSTWSSFHFISFHHHFLSPYTLSPYILSLLSHCLALI